MIDAAPVIALEGVHRSFSGPPQVDALRGLDLRVHAGESVALIGPSGAGKSTALNMLGLLDTPTRGRVLLDGQDISNLGDGELSRLRGQELGFIFQSFHLIPYRTVLQNVALGLRYTTRTRAITTHRVRDAVSAVGLDARRNARCSDLSGGETQRVAIARAVVHRPRLLLADEPTGNLDSARGAQILDLLDSLRTGESSRITVTHDLAVAERADRVIEIIDGQSVSDDMQ
ncbi:MAG: ABC transporter ATP-binding protein [Brachybacterium sp.]|uniref:ABC transporter ATP-binding protein n=1 Tax=Brachybacterium sp. TaxID=1891286 RepID=UPI00264DBE56|nr:ABC transporter ATP-binding protein [Brachybacterium sp.]MDN6302306.1 ABC transporter ATP-binding protein [Brachybacterium sp.]